jgi:hypothetical protein
MPSLEWLGYLQIPLRMISTSTNRASLWMITNTTQNDQYLQIPLRMISIYKWLTQNDQYLQIPLRILIPYKYYSEWSVLVTTQNDQCYKYHLEWSKVTLQIPFKNDQYLQIPLRMISTQIPLEWSVPTVTNSQNDQYLTNTTQNDQYLAKYHEWLQYLQIPLRISIYKYQLWKTTKNFATVNVSTTNTPLQKGSHAKHQNDQYFTNTTQNDRNSL